MTRTVLYYPTISIPNSAWLRQAVFYFDKVASIAPQALWNPDKQEVFTPLTPELDYLLAEDVYEPIFPEILCAELGPIKNPERQNWQVAHGLRAEFETKIRNGNFRVEPNSKFVRVHNGKLHGSLLHFLGAEGLLKYDVPEDNRYSTEWLLVEERTALLYLSMLAQALSDIHPSSMVPGTDRPEYEKLIYDAPSRENGFFSIETHLHSILPVPRDDVPLSELLDFKRKREAELLGYRTQIEELHKSLKSVTTPSDVKETLTAFQESQTRSLANLTAALNDARIATVWGSLKTLIKADSPAALGTAVVLVGAAASIAAVPISIIAAGIVVTGVVEVGSYLIDERNKRRASERESPFSYLYHAQQTDVLDRRRIPN